jgi:hypothetical protein
MHGRGEVTPSEGADWARTRLALQGAAGALAGKCFVVSGVLDSMTRDECAAYIQRHGGQVGKSLTLKVRDNVPRLRELKKSRTRGCGLHPSCVCAEMTTLPKVDTNCTAPSRIPTVNGNTVRSFSTHGHQSAAKGSLTTVSRSDIRIIQHLDSSALGLVRRWRLIWLPRCPFP